jgi:hypothetical protein
MSADNYLSVGMDITRFLDTNTAVQKPFKEMIIQFDNIKKLVSIFSAAVQKLAEGVIPDPTVGENACQLRAGLYTEIVNSPNYEELIAQSKQILDTTRKRLMDSTFKIVRGRAHVTSYEGEKTEFRMETIEGMCRFLKIDTRIDSKIALIAEGIILDFVRPCTYSFAMENGQVVINQDETYASTAEVAESGFTSVIAVKKLSDTIKKHLSRKSSKFVARCAAKAKPPDEAVRLVRMVTGDRVRDTKLGFRAVPCFSSSQAVFCSAAENATPLVVRIFRTDATTAAVVGAVELFFIPTDGVYQPVPKETIAAQRAAMLCEAVSAASPPLSEEEIKMELSGHNIIQTIMAFMATHPVYGGDLKGCKGHEEETEARQPFKAIAKEFGFCIKNQRVCRPFHMLAVPTKQFFTQGET